MNAKTLFTMILIGLVAIGTSGTAAGASKVKANPERDCFFGDTHAHSQLSTDAFGFGNRLLETLAGTDCGLSEG